MRLSLRAQVALVIVVVSLATVAAILLTSQRQLVEEFSRFEGASDTTFVARAAATLEARAAAHADARGAGADSALAAVERPRGIELVLVDAADSVVAASSPQLRHGRLSTEGRGPGAGAGDRPARAAGGRGAPILLTFESPGRPGAVMRLMFDRLPRRVVRGADGRPLGTVLSLSLPREGQLAERERLRGAASRGLVIPLVACTLVALLVLLLLTARVLSPVRALTRAVERLGEGHRGERVAVAGAHELAALSQAFNRMAESLERGEDQRRQMVSDVAHELRTPLTNLRCQLEAMRDGLAPADIAAVRTLHDETLLLARLVEDLQLLALADAGRLRLERRRVDARDLAEAAVAAMAPRAAQAGVALERAAGEPVPCDADPERLGQVLRNLVGNALDHSRAGDAVTLAVRAERGRAVLEVRDRGEGIAPEHLPHVFDRFWRADPSRARGSGGAGLGLAIAKQLVALHGGTLAVESAPGAGACFRIELPLAAAFIESSSPGPNV